MRNRLRVHLFVSFSLRHDPCTVADEHEDSFCSDLDHNGSCTMAYRNNDSIHLFGDYKRSAFYCEHDKNARSNRCTATNWNKSTETSFDCTTQPPKRPFYAP